MDDDHGGWGRDKPRQLSTVAQIPNDGGKSRKFTQYFPSNLCLRSAILIIFGLFSV
jgi:hypothetical protein